ncbi:MAG TPA: hypothetical protein VH186_03510 [Chloroflexia bacterium]|nr:hypothetical protein [Chloroflexia bacterium]
MARLDQVLQQLRFGLEQLSANNAQHEFEHLCRHLARARICSNILPATGPVSTGGDQGRDFETFRTYLNSTPISSSTFIGLASNKPIAFACTLQKEITGKVKSDVTTIMTSGSEIEAIYFFCTKDVPVAIRHQLQDWAKKTYKVHLEIQDGQAIAELLADREIFWIAERYLSIPAEIYPVVNMEDEDEWYKSVLDKWKERVANAQSSTNHADFVEIKNAIRYISSSTQPGRDLSFWLSLLESFIQSNHLLLKRQAIYEVSVASLKGHNSMLGQETQLRQYFSKINELDEPAELEDAQVLLFFCLGAARENKVQLTEIELSQWKNELITQIENRLEEVTSPGSICALLEVRGYLAFPDLDKTMDYWLKLIGRAKNAPLFPLERFADRLTTNILIIGDHPQYELLTQKVDRLVADRFGEFTAAQKSKERAMKFHQSGKTLRAINELHQAKVKWFAAETLRGAILSMLFIADGYKELGLSFAGKYYALAVASLVWHSSNLEFKRYFPSALTLAATCDYSQGAWASYLDLTALSIKGILNFTDQVNNFQGEDELQNVLFFTPTLMALTERIDPQLFKLVKATIAKWELDDWLEDYHKIAKKAWKKVAVDEIWQKIQTQLNGRPFTDLGRVRQAIWSELGISWTVNWDNEYETNKIVEQFLAIFQMVLADLAGIDMALLKTSVTIEIELADAIDVEVKSLPSNDDRQWKIVLPSYNQKKSQNLDKLQTDAIGATAFILRDISLLPRSQFDEALKNLFKRGISAKTFVVKPYVELYSEFVSKESFESLNRKSLQPFLPYCTFALPDSKPELDWISGPGPTYSRNFAEEMLENRYHRLLTGIERTVKRLKLEPDFQTTLRQLKQEGWLDWHILTCISNITINYQITEQLKSKNGRDSGWSYEAYDRLLRQYMQKPESENDIIVPMAEFSREKFYDTLRMTMLNTIQHFDLECHQQTPDLVAIEHFLKERYNYWADDIEHDNPFV